MSTLLFVLSAALILLILRGYDAITARLAAGRALARREHLPAVSILLPVVNEAEHLAARLANLAETDYPPELLELFVIDNGSADATVEIAEGFARSAPFPTTVLRSERGKIRAINAGLAAARRPWALVTDADVRAEPDALRRLASAVGEGVGAASALPVLGLPGEPARLAFTDSKRRFHDRDYRLRALESRLHSACSLDGKFMLFRRDLAPAGIPAETLVDDYELTFMVVARGERCVLVEDAVVYEGYPETAEDDLRQIRRRTAQGLLMAWRHARFAFNPRYGAFGLWTYPFRRFLIYYLPFLLAYEALWIVARAPLWGTLALAAAAAAMAWTGRTYPFVLLGGMLLGWRDLATGRGADFGRGGVWSRRERSA